MKRIVARARASRPMRVWTRYGRERGNLLAGGIAYVGLFSMFPALALGFTAFGLVLGGDTDLQRRVVDYINQAFSTTVIGMEPGQGVVSIDQLVQGNVLGVTGLVALGVMLFTGLGWIDALRQGIRAMFGLPRLASPILHKALDVLVLLVIGIAVLVSAVVGVVLSSASGAVLDLIGVNGPFTRLLIQVLAEVAVLVVDTGLFLMFFRFLARAWIPMRDMVTAAVIGAVGLHVLKLGSGLLMRQASNNAYLATAAIVIGLLLWFNLVARLTLLAASWAAVTAIDHDHEPQDLIGADAGDEAAEDAEEAEGGDDEDAREPAVDTRSARTGPDRLGLTAGAVLGGATVGLAGALTRLRRRHREDGS